MRVGNFSLLIPQGRERDSGHVEVVHGTVYTIQISNHDHRRCDAVVSVDGKEVGGFRLNSHGRVNLEHPVDDQGCFTFFRSDSVEAEAANVGGVDRDRRGLVQVVFRPERQRPPQKIATSALCGSSGRGFSEEKTAGGITGLTGRSDQHFGTVVPLDWDQSAEVTITLRLVASDVPAVRELRQVRGNPVPMPIE